MRQKNGISINCFKEELTIDIAQELEKLIAIYFNGQNYTHEGKEYSREDSKIIAYSLIHTLQLLDMIISKKD